MAIKTDRMSAQDRILRNFGKTLKSGSREETKTLSLAEQLKQLEQDEIKARNAAITEKSTKEPERIRFAGWCIKKS